MSEDWAGIAAEVAGALSEVGTLATIERPGALDETTYPPRPGAPVTLTFSAVIGTYTAKDRAGTNIAATDVKLLLSAGDLTAVPKTGDKVAVSGKQYSVVHVSATKPAGVAVVYEVQASVS